MVAGDSKEKAEQLRADVMALETSVEAFRVARDDTQTIEDQLRTSWYDNAKQAEFIAYELIGLRNATKELVESVQELVEHELLKHLKEGVEKVEKVPRGDITVVTAAQLEAAESKDGFLFYINFLGMILSVMLACFHLQLTIAFHPKPVNNSTKKMPPALPVTNMTLGTMTSPPEKTN
ncbi:hypothetical protein BC829DRAFT_396736 [Chytridium lagenaria]|nr:hypothetical protein BC829DRAFT_396736 [Chytridium lagenaria]